MLKKMLHKSANFPKRKKGALDPSVLDSSTTINKAKNEMKQKNDDNDKNNQGI